mgnify:CR=1 FL=1|jgi:hypothetical protein
MLRKSPALFLATAIIAISATPSTVLAASWLPVTYEDGIAVYTKDVPGRGFPTFRGVGMIEADIFDVLAVISDIKRHPEWMSRCKESRLLDKKSETEYIVYTRTDAPWPVSDRDAVFHSKSTVNIADKEVIVRFWAVRSNRMPKVNGVVRMVELNGRYKLKAWGKGRTKIDYMVDANPGGMIPTWMAKMATKKMPLITIQKLRKQIKRTKGKYAERIARWKKTNWQAKKQPGK